jgi:hypothetical protein
MVRLQAYLPVCGVQVTHPASHAMLAAVSVRVLVVALVLQLVIASAFAIWAATGFPLP